ncbi:ankyrin repeat domain-containing protein [Catenuloplanes sp. NPDC051500]|uniref:ankyrin repeat domain-containing protein n=1 Tax=Catenuloplanes sp. NPDC051500 TaxID=3363959 RepID=UPI0037B243FE
MPREQMSSWREARRYAVPPAMVREATARREAGDVAGACAAARTDLLVNLAQVRRTRGAEIADRLAGDLRHLAPDLVRWHAPREEGGGPGALAPRRWITLARYGDDALQVHTPRLADGPQRLQLRFGRHAPHMQADRWDRSRHLWDARAAGDLFARLGGVHRLPFHAPDGRLLDAGELPVAQPGDPVALAEWTTLLIDRGDERAAWAAVGIPAEERVPRLFGTVSVTALRATLDREFATRPLPDGPVALVAPRLHAEPTVIHHTGGEFSARYRSGDELRFAVELPQSAFQRSADLELLRLALITPKQLHPLVRDALFPGLGGDYRPEHRPTPPQTRVRCRAGWHLIGWRDGRIDTLGHPPAENAREQAMLALGGAVPGCFTIERNWRAGRPRSLPRDFQSWRRHALSVVLHGDDSELVRLLDAGVDPIGIDHRDGRGLLHMLAHLDRPDLIGRLVAAGLDPHARDVAGRTPLASVLWNGGSAALVRALLDAGASARTVDSTGATPLHLLHSTDAVVILPWLLSAGLDLEQTDKYGRTPMLALLAESAPAEPIRALADAGANLHAVTPRRRTDVPSLIAERGRVDLDFLLTAHLEASS